MSKQRHLKIGIKKACPENFRRGLTLMEILVGITMSTLLIGALYGVYLVSYKTYTRSVNQAELNQNARIAMERMGRDIRQATNITSELPPDNTNPLFPAHDNIKFRDGHVTDRIQYIEYYLVNNELHRKLTHYCFSSTPETCLITDWVTPDVISLHDGFGPAEAIDEDTVKADSITNLQFYGSSNLIGINITVTNGISTYKSQTAIYARNI